jgi:hypothetical protein
LDYFHVQEWEERWIDVAENLVREEYISEYEDRALVDDDTQMADKASNSLSCCFDLPMYGKQGSDDGGFGNISIVGLRAITVQFGRMAVFVRVPLPYRW